jgi:hypothetical protein
MPRCNYSRDLQPLEWGRSAIHLHRQTRFGNFQYEGVVKDDQSSKRILVWRISTRLRSQGKRKKFKIDLKRVRFARCQWLYNGTPSDFHLALVKDR